MEGVKHRRKENKKYAQRGPSRIYLLTSSIRYPSITQAQEFLRMSMSKLQIWVMLSGSTITLLLKFRLDSTAAPKFF